MTQITVATLPGLVLADPITLRRDHVRNPERRSAHYLERFDSTTLFYDCVRLADRGTYLFTAPRLLNLYKPFIEGLRIDGKAPTKVKRRKWLRCEQVEVTAPEGAVTVELEGHVHTIAARTGLAAGFAGANSLLAVNKNNKLKWIRDWASYYNRAHGADAVVLFDNGSTDYSPQDIADTLGEIDGLRQVAVFSAPYPYGPTDRSRKLEISPRFFQTSMLNIARRDALAQARAVLSVDIDEIAVSHTGDKVFDMAVNNPVGMISIHGSWIFPPEEATEASDHGVHVFRQVPDKKCNRKWCLTPNGIMSKFGWAVHQIGGPLQDIATNQSKVSLLHCRGTSTGWKKMRYGVPEEMERDPKIAELMAEYFPVAPTPED